MIKFGQPNPLNVFGLRQLDTNPPHFTGVPFELKASNKQITDWIWENLEGRFWFGDHYEVDQNGAVQMIKMASFERASEASYFALVLPDLNVHQYF